MDSRDHGDTISVAQVGGEGILRKGGGRDHRLTGMDESKVFRKNSSRDLAKDGSGRRGRVEPRRSPGSWLAGEGAIE